MYIHLYFGALNPFSDSQLSLNTPFSIPNFKKQQNTLLDIESFSAVEVNFNMKYSSDCKKKKEKKSIINHSPSHYLDYQGLD